jgi:uncharacterized protein (DUF305 family)
MKAYRVLAVLGLAMAGHVLPAAAQSGTTTYPGRYPFTEADVHFISGMIHHHAQALVMAALIPERTSNASLRTLGRRVIASQEDEIVLFQSWLEERNQPVPEPTPGPVTMKMNGMEHDMLMPGMLTEEQVTQLEAASGVEFERLFLTYMIQHHQGAITMVNQLFSSAGAAQDDAVYKFASDIYADQSTEIERMQQMLSTLPPR